MKTTRNTLAILATLFLLTGCQQETPPSDATQTSAPDSDVSQQTNADSSATPEEDVAPVGLKEIDANKLIGAALSREELVDGWVRLFDGQSLFGWFVVGQANWNITDGVLSVDKGEKSFLCTSFQLADYELIVEYRATDRTNSGVFLRTQPKPEDVATKCLELNIAPTDNPFPTGSFVQRKKLEPTELGELEADAWHRYHVRLVGDEVQVQLDGKPVMEMAGFESSKTGHISLQFNEGRIEFREVLLRPLANRQLATDMNWEQDWTKTVKDGAELDVTPEDDGLRLKGGLGQLQSKAGFGDFVLQANYSLADPAVNSGIFFRCVPDAMLDGYECQLNHAMVDDDPLQPADAGAGAIFRRADARVVIGDGKDCFVTIAAIGPQIHTWINGVQMVDFRDERKPDENPRRGLRTEAGPISLQGHDPGTDVTFHKVEIREL